MVEGRIIMKKLTLRFAKLLFKPDPDSFVIISYARAN